MKVILITTILLFSSIIIFGQESKIITDKDEYKFDEIIELTFEIDARFDSIDLPDYNAFESFKIISGPNKSSSISINNGEQTIVESRIYKLRALESGLLTIYPPTYFIGQKKIKGKPLKIKVYPSTLTSKEIEEKEYKEFIVDGIKPKGTTRIILHENRGYIEVFKEMGWEFKRRLTFTEIEQLKKIK